MSRALQIALAGIACAFVMISDGHAASVRGHGGEAASVPATEVTVERTPLAPPIPPGFVGLSMEYSTLPLYAGLDSHAIDPVLTRLIQNLAPRQQPVLRIGGTTTDWAWSPVAGVARPPWVRFVLSNRWLEVARALTSAARARLILSINLAADSPVIARSEASSLLRGIGRAPIQAFELGNEPELYGRVAWYQTAGGRSVQSRPRRYDFAAYMRDYSNVAHSLPPVPLAGPSTGKLPAWTKPLGRFLGSEPRVGLVTLHRYGLDRCDIPRPTLTARELLSSRAQKGIAASVAQPAQVAHAHGVPLRIEELNAVACGGQSGVSNTFVSALWALNTLFESARVGVDGVNIHTRASGLNSLFTVTNVAGRWRAHVRPEYYGLLMFTKAVPSGSRLLRITSAVGGPVHSWATAAPDGHVRVVLINEDVDHPRTVRLRVPSVRGPGVLERLSAPSSTATSDVTIGGRSFGSQTTSGLLVGRPALTSVLPAGGNYIVELPAATAAMLTF